MKTSTLFVFLVSFAVSGLAQSSIITTYVGPPPPVMNGAPAIAQSVDRPNSVAPDGAGGFYVSSASQHRIFRVAADGTLTVIAGNGTAGFSGDGGPATAARININTSGGALDTIGIALDTAGNLYLVDTNAFRVRKVTPDGVIRTVAGNGTYGFSGDGGPAISAQLWGPRAIAVDTAGNLYIADTSYDTCIRKVTTDGLIHTVVGDCTGFSGNGRPSTSTQLGFTTGLAVDATGNLYIADNYDNRILKLTPAGTISIIARIGPYAFSGDPFGIAVDAAGALFFVDNASRVLKVTADGIIRTVAGNGTLGFSGDNGPAASAQLNAPSGLAVDVTGDVYVADTKNSRVRKVTASGVINTVAGNGAGFGGDGGPATSAHLEFPTGIAIDATGTLYIADTEDHRVRKVTTDGVVSTVAGNGRFEYREEDGGPAMSAGLWGPRGMAVDMAGNLYVAGGNNNVRKVTPAGVITTVAGGRYGFGGDGGPATAALLSFPTGVAVDVIGNLYIADSGNYRVRKVTLDGVISTIAGNGTSGFGGDGGPATFAELSFPSGVAVDTVGNLYIADSGDRRVRRVTAGGVISTIATSTYDGSAAYRYAPQGVAVDAAGNVYVSGWSSVRKVTAGGVISTVAGNGISGFSGDGGPAASAQLNRPGGIAVDAAGNVYIADTDNQSIRRVGYANDLPLVTDIRFDPVSVSVQSSWTATFSGVNLTDQTYFDVRFQRPDTGTDQVALNWQRGTAAPHSVPSGTDAGTWTVTGVRAHQSINDHSDDFVSVSKTLTVTPSFF